MWGESSKRCEINCQCSGLITESFKINSGNNATKRKQEDSMTHNYKLKMSPQTIDFTKSPISPIYTSITGKRRILGEIQIPKSPLERLKSPHTMQKSPVNINSPLLNRTSPVLFSTINNKNSSLIDENSPVTNRNSPVTSRNSPLNSRNSPLTAKNSPLSSRSKRSRITKVMEERTRFKNSNKENECVVSETYINFDVEEETRDYLFANKFQSKRQNVMNWSTRLDFSHTLPAKEDIFVPQKDVTHEPEEIETLHDLEEELEADNFDECTKYEIISTDSPNIISRGRATSTRKVIARNFDFGAPLAENETSTSFNKPIHANRMLNFDEEDFEFPSPAVKKQAAKKSLKFSETPTKLRHEKSDSSIGSMNSSSQSSPKSVLYTTESTTSMESGFISEFDEPFLEIDESNSPKVANFNELLSGQIKTNVVSDKTYLRRPLNRSLSHNPQNSKARMSLFSILENPGQRNCKRMERTETEVVNKKRKSNCLNSDIVSVTKIQRPLLQRALSENNASIMSAMARSIANPDLIGDFSVPFALPLTTGDHSDLKSISCETLAGLLKGEFRDTISDFQVIDCRYPYEFEGGHIINAINYYTPTQVLQLIQKPLHTDKDGDKRSVLIFHCEFSIERGPKLSRFLRSSDRQHNAERYPHLHYPELYLLHSGYRAFYHQYPELCTPSGYTAMLDPKYKNSLRHHRSQ